MSAEYIDAAAILAGDFNPPVPTRGGKREDGLHLLYPASVNGLVGDPETGKTLIATACAADELYQGGSVLWLDLDHNGPSATLTRFRRYGIPEDVLVDPARFRLAIPEDAPALLAIVADAANWRPTVAVLDSVGEMLPMFGASSNSADEYTAVNQQTLVKLARCGAAVLGLDHMAKGTDSRAYGAGGTVAKKRAIDGAYLRVTTEGGFSKGIGGRADLSIIKDRHGALREASGPGREPRLTVFTLEDRQGAQHWTFNMPAAQAPMAEDFDALLEQVLAMNPPPSGYRAIKSALGVRDDLAQKLNRALKNSAPSAPGAHPVQTHMHRTHCTPPLEGGAGASAGAPHYEGVDA